MHRLVIGCVLMTGYVLPATAQDTPPGGLLLGLSVGQQLVYDDGDTLARSTLGLTLSSETRNQRLLFDVGTGLDLGLSSGTGNDLEDPRLGLDYGLENRNTALAFNLNYQRRDIDTAVAQSTLDTGVLVIDAGDREDLNTGVTLTLGSEARFGATLSLAFAETNFFNTTSPDVIDSETLSGAARLRFDLTRNVTAFLGYAGRDLDREGGTDVVSDSVTASVEVQVTEALQTTFELGATRIEQRNDLTGIPSAQDGLSYGVSVVAERPNGALSGLLDSDITENGRRTTIRVNRQLTLPRGAISGGVGVSKNSDLGGNFDPLYNLTYTLNLPRSTLNAGLSQQFSTSSTGIEALNSRFSLSLRQSLTTKASLNAAFGFSDTDQRGAGVIDSNQLDLSFSYAYELTPDWDLFGGFGHIRRRTDGQADTTDNQVFIGLRANFEWRP